MRIIVESMIVTRRRSLFFVLLFAAAQRPYDAAAQERITADWRTGLALYGFDPVSYFESGGPSPGLPEFEQRIGQAVWRFRSAGNRAAFASAPNVYTPRFGGYDPVAMARAVAVPGHPYVWAVAGERLYLFGSANNRQAFMRDTERVIAAAVDTWPAVAKTLLP